MTATTHETGATAAYAEQPAEVAVNVDARPVQRWATIGGGVACALAGGTLIARAVKGRTRASGDDDHSPAASVGHKEGVRVEKTVTINKSPEELYRFWRNFENLPRFMDHLESVQVKDATHSHWKAKGPAKKSVEWDAVIISDVANEVIAWKSTDAQIANAGSVRFRNAPGGRGAEVTVNLEYDPPAGKLGMFIAKMFGEEPTQQVQDDLRRFKQVMEAGEIPTTDGQPTGRS
ncbi:MAG: SRPBCC family protein [Thermomicrobia bacterium]|nr:SRPBCC family protein [Thermomicrobia bacterium]